MHSIPVRQSINCDLVLEVKYLPYLSMINYYSILSTAEPPNIRGSISLPSNVTCRW